MNVMVVAWEELPRDSYMHQLPLLGESQPSSFPPPSLPLPLPLFVFEIGSM